MWINRAGISRCVLVGVISCLFVFPTMYTNYLIFGYASQGVSLHLLSCSTVLAIQNLILWFFFHTCNCVGNMYSLLHFTMLINRAEISRCIQVGVISCLFVFPSMRTNFLIFGYASKEYLSVCSAVYCFEQSQTGCLPEAICFTFFLTCNSVGTNMYSLLLFTCWLNRAEISRCILVGVISCLFVFPSMHTNFLTFGYASKEYLSVCSAVYCLSKRKLDAYQRSFAPHSSLPVIPLVLICTACYSLHVD